MPTSLGLCGDLDDIYMLDCLEEAFGIALPDEETPGCYTVGELFALIEARLPGHVSSGRCVTAMTFYRMRRALQPNVTTALRPNTPISALSDIPVKKLVRIIKEECGLNPPDSYMSHLQNMTSLWKIIIPVTAGGLSLSMLHLFPAGILPYGEWLAAALVIAVSGWKHNFLVNFFAELIPTRLPSSIATFGDLVRQVSSANVAKLAEPGAHLRAPEAWEKYKDVLTGHTLLARDLIDWDTLLLDPKIAAEDNRVGPPLVGSAISH